MPRAAYKQGIYETSISGAYVSLRPYNYNLAPLPDCPTGFTFPHRIQLEHQPMRMDSCVETSNAPYGDLLYAAFVRTKRRALRDNSEHMPKKQEKNFDVLQRCGRCRKSLPKIRDTARMLRTRRICPILSKSTPTHHRCAPFRYLVHPSLHYTSESVCQDPIESCPKRQ
jgi:hypothetical protein